MRFSQRIGKTPVREALQIETMDRALENSLWNSIHDDFIMMCKNYSDSRFETQTYRGNVCLFMWKEFFCNCVDDIPSFSSGKIRTDDVVLYVKKWFFSSEWYEKYDFIEFLCQTNVGRRLRFADKCNELLKNEMSGYRIINDQVVQITSEEEIAEIEDALSSSSKWRPVHEHLKTALEYLSDRENPQYRNSIKESISAVESMCKIIAKNKKATLGDALKELEKTHKLHSSYKQAFDKLYGYTSDSGGIRHCLLDDSVEVTMEDAKFMLVSCSAFINYLICKQMI